MTFSTKVQSKNDVKHRSMKMGCSNNLFPLLIFLNGKPVPYEKRAFLYIIITVYIQN